MAISKEKFDLLLARMSIGECQQLIKLQRAVELAEDALETEVQLRVTVVVSDSIPLLTDILHRSRVELREYLDSMVLQYLV